MGHQGQSQGVDPLLTDNSYIFLFALDVSTALTVTPSPPSTLLTLTTLTTRGRATTLAGCEAVIRDNEGENEKVGDDTNGISVRGIMQSGQGWEGSPSLFGINK